MKALFLVCALSLPGNYFNHSTIIPYHAEHKTDEAKLIDWIKKNNPGADVFIHERPQEDKFKEHGWERVPFTWNGKQIWIQRHPKTDRRAA